MRGVFLYILYTAAAAARARYTLFIFFLYASTRVTADAPSRRFIFSGEKVSSLVFILCASACEGERDNIIKESFFLAHTVAAAIFPLSLPLYREIEDTHAQTQASEEMQQQLLYSSEWLLLVASLAGIAKRVPTACVVAQGFGDPRRMAVKFLDAGLRWNSDGRGRRSSPTLENRAQFESAFQQCFFAPQRASLLPSYVVGIITLTSTETKSSHLMSYLYDTGTREFEVFDPNGGLQFLRDKDASDAHKKMLQEYFSIIKFEAAIRHYLQREFPIASHVRVPSEWCPKLGVQYLEESSSKEQQQQQQRNRTAMEEDFGGYCGAWSIWWLHSRLSAPPGTPRDVVMSQATERFVRENIDMRQYVTSFSRRLTNDTIRLMYTSLRIGGYTRAQCSNLIAKYKAAKNVCQRAENLAYHNPEDPMLQHRARHVCHKMNVTYLDVYLNEVQANIQPAVRLFSEGRLVMDR